MSGLAPRIWVTRTQPGAQGTADRLRAFGLCPDLRPLLTIRPVAGTPLLDGVGALAFTSVNGVHEFARRVRRRYLPVFAVGDATAQAALAAGFVQVRSAGGDIDDLIALILASRQQIRGRLLWAGAREPAGDLIGGLAAGGVEAVGCTLYESVPGIDEAEVAAALGSPADPLTGCLIYSPKGARRLAEVLGPRRPDAAFVCISPAAAAPLARLGLRAVSAARPNETRMLQRLLEELDHPASVP